MNELQMYIDNTRLAPKERAAKLHENIILHADMAAAHLIAFCQDLKTMKDEKLYTELGYKEFEQYTDTALGIKQRQAYNYIGILDKLGEEYMRENAKLGVSKLELLSNVTVAEREELEAATEIEDVSVKELKARIKELEDRNKQLSMLEIQNTNMKKELETDEETERSLQECIQQIKSEHADELERVRAEGVSDEVRQKLVEEAHAALQKEINQAEKDRVAAEKKAKEAEKEANKIKKELDAAQKEQAKIQKELENEKQQVKVDVETSAKLEEQRKLTAELEKKLSLVSNDSVKMFSLQFGYFQDAYKKIKLTLDDEAAKQDGQAGKFSEAILKFFQLVSAELRVYQTVKHTTAEVKDDDQE